MMMILPTHLSKIVLWGMPYHGLVANGRMALPITTLAELGGDDNFVPATVRALDSVCTSIDGIEFIVKDFPSIGKRYSIEFPLFDANTRSAGTSRLWQNPAITLPTRSTEQADHDAELGNQWLNYALFNGTAGQIAADTNKRLGFRTWVYLASDGSRWQIQLVVVDGGANPIQVRYKFRKFGNFREGAADTFSAESALISVPNSGFLVGSLRISSVLSNGSKALFATHEYNAWITSSAPIDHTLVNYGPMAWLYEFTVGETTDIAGEVIGISLASATLKSRTDLIKGLETVTPNTFGTIGGIDGSTSSVLLSRAFKKVYWLDAYYAGGVVEYVKLTYSDSITGTASSSYTTDPSVFGPPCFTGVFTSWNVQDQRSYVIEALFEVGADSYAYTSEFHIDRSEIVTPGAGNTVVGTKYQERIWRTTSPFVATSEHTHFIDIAVNEIVCISGAAYPSPPAGVSGIPGDVTYQAITVYKPTGSALPDQTDTLTPCWFINGEGIGGLLDLYFDSTWRYQYRLFNEHGTPHTLADAEVVIDTGQPLEYRIPLYGSAHPVTHDYIYAQETPVCYA